MKIVKNLQIKGKHNKPILADLIYKENKRHMSSKQSIDYIS